MPTIIIDNGSYEIKIGHALTGKKGTSSPRKILNCVAKSKSGEYLIDGQILSHSEANLFVKRPFEQGQLTSWELERSIWDYALGEVCGEVEASECDLVLSETAYTLPQLSINTDQIVFEEFGFEHYYRAPLASYIPWNQSMNQKIFGNQQSTPDEDSHTLDVAPYDNFQLVVDSGFNCTWIVPVLYGVTYWPGVKKFAIGGRLLNGYLRELISYRHYNLMEETLLVNHIKEETCFVASNFPKMVQQYHDRGRKNREVVQYALPDFKTSNRGYVVTDNTQTEDERQILTLRDERIAVPEVLFHPELANILNKPGIIKHILDAIHLCPPLLQPLLAANIILIGGNVKMDGLRSRLESELKKELPQEWSVRVAVGKTKGVDTDTYGWWSMNEFVSQDGFEQVKVSKKEYFEHGSNWCQQRFGFQ
ncbi:hypothetical protein BABINDRAFT_162346 [Babjeviella inositovora NRRL Y-12698]|uniref:Actin-like protein ARP6 n=1 Tax=Babjeviella inositovora NRRL Y-12698 TaxID=984486 RepID=A0A1E3QLZ2_9ASCO|nr:uncharacterized protein BABINDRAFT_162346 [Babjeviella inositovora NRRL Y-12698]ODQ78638.1 hypothetical protein BABINDRAFT_162346 [Babjeviella inositovora NRRL Y-12698]